MDVYKYEDGFVPIYGFLANADVDSVEDDLIAAGFDRWADYGGEPGMSMSLWAEDVNSEVKEKPFEIVIVVAVLHLGYVVGVKGLPQFLKLLQELYPFLTMGFLDLNIGKAVSDITSDLKHHYEEEEEDDEEDDDDDEEGQCTIHHISWRDDVQ